MKYKFYWKNCFFYNWVIKFCNLLKNLYFFLGFYIYFNYFVYYALIASVVHLVLFGEFSRNIERLVCYLVYQKRIDGRFKINDRADSYTLNRMFWTTTDPPMNLCEVLFNSISGKKRNRIYINRNPQNQLSHCVRNNYGKIEILCSINRYSNPKVI